MDQTPETKKKDCYLCKMFKNVFIFSFGFIAGMIVGVLFANTL